MITASGIYKSFSNQIHALTNVSFEIQKGEVIYVLGESGSGKSTLAKIIAGLEDSDQGSVHVGGEIITGPKHHLVPGYEQIAYVPQDFKLQAYWTVRDNIGKKISHNPIEVKEEKINAILSLCQLETYADRYPRELSGGQQQRIAMAAAVVDEPEVVVLDEPFSNLDLPMKSEVRQQVIDMLRKLAITVVLVSHDPAEALAVADRILLLNAGRVEQVDTPLAIYKKPRSYYAAKFLGPVNELVINKKKMLVRPEAMQIHSKAPLEGVIHSSTFMGMHYHTFIKSKISTRPILIYTESQYSKNTSCRFEVGEH